MRTRFSLTIFLVVMALVMVGCSSAFGKGSQSLVSGRSSAAASPIATSQPPTTPSTSAATTPTEPAPAAASPTPVATTAPTPTTAAAPTTAPQATAAPAATPTTVTQPARATVASATSPTQGKAATNESVTAAIKAVIAKANAEQQQAFAKNDPTIMKDTATTAYYNQLVQISQQMTQGGVSAIKLVQLEWGPVTIESPTSAKATTFETWRTTYSDSSVDQSRDQNDYTLVQQGGVWKIQSDVQPSTNLDQPPAVPSTVPGIVPPTSSVVPGSSNQSSNWSGYSATGGTYTAVSGTWIVPQSTATGNIASSATWVGIGGVTSHDLIQAGTEDTSTGSSNVSYDAWIETLPQASHRIPLVVSPGNSVTVSINEKGTDQWLIAFKNNTTGETYQTQVQYASTLSSAEWVEEAPSARRQLLPLDNFGTVKFTNGSAVKDGKTVTIAQANAQPITMINYRGDPLATTSALDSAGTGFTISRTTNLPTTTGPGNGRIPRRGFNPNPYLPLGPSLNYMQ